jgi:putative ABC transport system permease protein
MEKLFGLDMNLVAAVLGSALALILAVLALLAWRGRVMFRLGVRPIPRRPAQSALIVLGLMLATLIITAAFVAGDTLSHTLRSMAIEDLGEIDEAIRTTGGQPPYFKIDRYERLAAELNGYERIDQLVPAVYEQIPAVNATRRQSERYLEVLGLRSDDIRLLQPGERTDVNGAPLPLDDLGPHEVYLNAVAAKALAAEPGDELQLYADDQPTTFFVRAITATGQNPRLIMPLRRAQLLFNQGGNINTIYVSNRGDALAGAELSPEVTTRLRGLLTDPKTAHELFDMLAQDPAAAAALRGEAAQRSGNLQKDLLALAAGLEMGELNAEVRSLLADEGLGFWVQRVLEQSNWHAAAARDRLRWLFAHLSEMTVDTNKRNRIEEGDDIASAATVLFVATGLFSIASGLLLIFLIFVMLAAERKSEMGMTRAIGGQRRHLIEMFVHEGTAYDLAAAGVGVALGVGVGFAAAAMLPEAFGDEINLVIRPYLTARSLGVSYSLGMLVTFATVLFSAYKVSRLNIVAAIRDLPEPAPPPTRLHNRLLVPLFTLIDGFRHLFRLRLRRALGAWVVSVPLSLVRLVWAGFTRGPLTLLFGLWVLNSGLQNSSVTAFGLGVSFAAVGAGLMLRSLLNRALERRPGLGDRLTFTLVGPALAVFWSLPLDAFESLGVKGQNVGPEFFFFSGVFLVTGAVLVLMYNTDLLLWAVRRAQGLPLRIVPVLRMAMAYSLASRFRTGLTLGMFAVVVFSVIFVAALFKTEDIYFANTAALTGGYDLRVETSYTNPVDDLEAAIAASPHLRQSDYALVASQARAYLEMRQGGGPWYGHMVTGVNTAFLESTRSDLLVMAEGYKSPAEVWRALRDRPGTALIDRYSVPSHRRGSYGGGFNFELGGVYVEDETMPPLVIEVRDPATRATFHVTLIGVFEPTSSLYGGLVTSQATLDEGLSFSTPPTTHYLRLAEGIDPTAAGRALESAFLRYGLESTDLLAEVKQQSRSQRVIVTLLQGFLTLGLVVGVAALGVISTRAVVERRQQIGMLRALGFRREMVGWSFVLESSFIALLGITLGAALALIPARNLIAYSAQDAPGMRFQIPWDSIALVVAVAYGMTLLTTWLPAVQASRVPPAEALRYE